MKAGARTARAIVGAALWLGLLLGPARAETLIVSLSSSRLAITSNYTGGLIVAFGAIERDAQTIARTSGYDVVVTVRGPRQAITVREKEPLGPVWLNREQQKFPEVPAFLGVYSSRPLKEITSDALRARFRLGIDAIVGAPDFTLTRDGADAPFRQALVRLRKREGLYLESERGVSFLTGSLFRAGIALPATAPPGGYDVEVSLLIDGLLLTRTQTHFELVKSGFEQRVGDLARDRGLIYGLGTAALALGFGWLATVIFRRD
ncbi:MAG TPA: TIGR02186 family protein [Beijerinckiaceae bacterium]|jgi:uncharacterized protein (TIGR02186 family)